MTIIHAESASLEEITSPPKKKKQWGSNILHFFKTKELAQETSLVKETFI